MSTYRVTDPSTGKTVKLTGDSPPSESELEQIFSSINSTQTKNQPSLIERGWDSLAVPENKSREGLQMLAQLSAPKTEVTGNMTRDIAANLPRIGLESLAETAPSFISRGAILTAGALKGLKIAAPAIKAIGRGVARGAESISGLEYKTPGVLTEAANNPKLIFSPGKDAAGQVYETAKGAGGEVRQNLAQIPEKIKMVKKALSLANDGQLNPTEALEARKELSAIKKTVSGEFFRKAIDKFNEVAKPVFEEADKAYQQGVKSDAMRMLLPVNKMGGTSIAKSTLGTIAGVVPLAAMSPIVQGAAATGIGVTAKAASPLINNPVTTAAVSQVAKLVKTLTEDKAREYLKKAKNDPAKARKAAIKDGWTIPE